jgi:hypothetical protein
MAILLPEYEKPKIDFPSLETQIHISVQKDKRKVSSSSSSAEESKRNQTDELIFHFQVQ